MSFSRAGFVNFYRRLLTSLWGWALRKTGEHIHTSVRWILSRAIKGATCLGFTVYLVGKPQGKKNVQLSWDEFLSYKTEILVTLRVSDIVKVLFIYLCIVCEEYVCVEGREQLYNIISLFLPLCGVHEWNSGCAANDFTGWALSLTSEFLPYLKIISNHQMSSKWEGLPLDWKMQQFHLEAIFERESAVWSNL